MIDWKIGQLYETRCGLIVKLNEVLDSSYPWPLIFEVKGQLPVTEISATLEGTQNKWFKNEQKVAEHLLDIVHRVEITRYTLTE